jgi:hypothetical protein
MALDEWIFAASRHPERQSSHGMPWSPEQLNLAQRIRLKTGFQRSSNLHQQLSYLEQTEARKAWASAYAQPAPPTPHATAETYPLQWFTAMQRPLSAAVGQAG